MSELFAMQPATDPQPGFTFPQSLSDKYRPRTIRLGFVAVRALHIKNTGEKNMRRNEAAELLSKMATNDLYGPMMREAFALGASALVSVQVDQFTRLADREAIADIQTLDAAGLRILPADEPLPCKQTGYVVEAFEPLARLEKLTQFVAINRKVKRGKFETVAEARSNTFAKRIANALNLYTPNRRGQ